MKKNRVKLAVAALVAVAAGVIYACSPEGGGAGIEWDTQQEQAGEGSETESGDGGGSAAGDAGEIAAGGTGGNAAEDAGKNAADSGPADFAGQSGNPEYTEQNGQRAENVIWVHVCGEVLKPGVYELEPGSRVWQAVEAAGGFSEEADQEFLNMALTLEDGMKLVIPNQETARQLERESETGGGVYGGGIYGAGIYGGGIYGAGIYGAGISGTQRADLQAGIFPAGNAAEEPAAGNASAKVNINTASREVLMTLKGIGGSRADDIIAYREANGPFQKIEDIMKVSGIKEASFEKIKQDITV